jgi:recombinational DNA repair protein (RecF pathway)
MQEYGGEAIVLRREVQGEADTRVSLFLKRFGKLTAKAKSARKITSKLSSHLEPGMVSEVRLVEKNDMLVTDALKSARVSLTSADLYFLDKLLGEADPDPVLWELVRNGDFSWERALQMLGWDPTEALCEKCEGAPAAFHIARQSFFCAACSVVGIGKEMLRL